MQAISAALVKAQKEFGPALKTHTNPAFRSKYAGLDACIEAVIDALNNNGIFLMQPTHECEGGVIVETLFIHESGEQLSSGKLHVPATKLDAQGYGSALTYARRYSLMAACGIAPEDDDGNAASKPAPKPTAAPTPKPAPKAEPIPEKMEGRAGEWQIAVTRTEGGSERDWAEAVVMAAQTLLSTATKEDDVVNIFKKNRSIFEMLKTSAPETHGVLMESFAKYKAKFKEQA